MGKIQKQASELMPKDEESLRVLRSRAEQLAAYEENQNTRDYIAYVHFKLREQEDYGISYDYVHEILHDVPLARPPGVPDFVAGVMNWRGSLITVVDLLTFFHSSAPSVSRKFVIVTCVNKITLGLLVYQIKGSDYYQEDELSPALIAASVAPPEYILGLHEVAVAILNIDNLLPGLNQEVKKRIMEGEFYGNR